MSSWRPACAYDVPLTDAELAKVGLVAALETQARTLTAIALKAVLRLSYDEWRKWLERPFDQMVARLQDAVRGLDEPLERAVAALAEVVSPASVLRHQFVHGLFAINEGHEAAYAYDWKRLQKVERGNLDSALGQVASLTIRAKECAQRCAELIAEGRLPEREEGPGPKFRSGGRWVRL